MASCVSGDISKFSTGEITIGNCIAASVDDSSFMIPSGSVIQSCMSSAGISTECSSCWGNLFDSIKTCMVDTCGFTMSSEDGASSPPLMENGPSEQCISCLTNMSGSMMPSESGESMIICGIDPQAMGTMGENVRNQLGVWMGGPQLNAETTSSSTPTTTASTTGKSVSVKSITTSVIVFAALLMVC